MPIFPNQIDAALEIVTCYNICKYVVLSAQMQSGKTGTSLWVAYKALELGLVKKVFIISGNRNTALRDQWISKVKEFRKLYLRHKENSHFSALEAEIFDEIEVIWGQNLLSQNISNFKESLIIWDESHYGSSENQTLHTFFTQIGIYKAIQTADDSVLRENGIYLLSVSATAVAEISANYHNGKSKKKIVNLIPGDEYRGVEYYWDNRKVYYAFKINDDTKENLRGVILDEDYVGKKKYIIVRASDSKKKSSSAFDILKAVCDEEDIPIIEYTANTKNEYKDILSKEPYNLTVVRISGMLRMGDEMPKEHICAVFESSPDIKTDTALQGLLGRCCGYHGEDIDIYLPEEFIENGLNEYLEAIENNFSSGLSNCMNVGKRKSEKKGNRFNYPIVPIHIPYSSLHTIEGYTFNRKDQDSWEDLNLYVIQYVLENERLVYSVNGNSRESHEFLQTLRNCINESSTYNISTRNASSYRERHILEESRNCISKKKGFTLFNTKKVIIGYISLEEEEEKEYGFSKGDVIIYGWTDDKDIKIEPHVKVEERSIFVKEEESKNSRDFQWC